ncbi:MAG: hypothetical protein IKR49_11555 [Clostridia bacterium]|nr:hypothetical protein [Clostridia bacterium]
MSDIEQWAGTISDLRNGSADTIYRLSTADRSLRGKAVPIGRNFARDHNSEFRI